MQPSDKMIISLGARSSPLSLAQVIEVEKELQQHHSHIDFKLIPIETQGDRDLKTSLRTLDKTDFFTRDIDDALLEGKCRIALHSAKDLPSPLRSGIQVVALTNGVDSSDSLVLKEGMSLNSLPHGARIATSSLRREEIVRSLREGLEFIDVRGTIGQRLSLLEQGFADGIVVAEAALIRLGLTHLKRIRLPGETAPLQGKLAVMARSDDLEIEELFSCLDTREVHLHTGITFPRNNDPMIKTLHCPLIETVPLPFNSPELLDIKHEFSQFTHLIFTSKTAVHYTIQLLENPSLLKRKECIAVGDATGETLKTLGCDPLIPSEATAEGVCALLDILSLENSYLLWLHSSLARPVISNYLNARKLNWKGCALYNTLHISPPHLPSLEKIDRVIFSSPSTIDAFLKCYRNFPSHLHYECIGPVTKERLISNQGVPP